MDKPISDIIGMIAANYQKYPGMTHELEELARWLGEYLAVMAEETIEVPNPPSPPMAMFRLIGNYAIAEKLREATK